LIQKLTIAQSIAQAVNWKAHCADCIYLSGGTEVNRLGSEDHQEGISIGRLNMDEIRMEGSMLAIGATVTFTEALESDLVPMGLKQALRHMDSMTKRNMATIGGNIAAKRDDSYIIPALVAMDAKLSVMDLDRSQSQISLWDYVSDPYSSRLLIIDILLDPKARIASRRISRTAQSHASITMSISLDPALACAAIKGTGIVRLEGVEKAIAKGLGGKDLERIGSEEPCQVVDDIHASAAYKRYLLGILAADLAGGLR
jgi:putative selenate reductase FAD-binding subunit